MLDERRIRVIVVAGARPNFMKIAPLIRELKSRSQCETYLVHTGQHYDKNMSDLFFRELEIPEPDVNLGVGSGSHAQQTADIMKAFEPVMLSYDPDAVLVVGDVNSTVACGLVSVKLGKKLIHVEAGLRSFDRSMPEEINRILTDAMSDLLFCSESSGVENLLKENIDNEKVFLVGNVMIDTLLYCKQRAQRSTILSQLGINGQMFAVLTLHRPSNVDDNRVCGGILEALNEIQKDMPVIFPVHPRSRNRFNATSLGNRLRALPKIHMIDPLGYMDFLKLISSANIVLTDSGGIQEETTVLKVPCLTLRENTERPVTVQIGSNQVVGTDPERIVTAYTKVISGNWREPQIPRLWDGKAAERIVAILLERLAFIQHNNLELVSVAESAI